MKIVREHIKESVNSETIEKLSDVEHDSWARWMKYVFSVSKKNNDGSITIPKNKVKRWERQIKTDYEDLTDKEKETDRKEVKKFIKILNSGSK
jgi:hypothetical protein